MTTFEAIVPHQQNLGQTQGAIQPKCVIFWGLETDFSCKLRKWLETLPHKMNVSRARIFKIKLDFLFSANLISFTLREPTIMQHKEVHNNIF
jgi:hypothetical protein